MDRCRLQTRSAIFLVGAAFLWPREDAASVKSVQHWTVNGILNRQPAIAEALMERRARSRSLVVGAYLACGGMAIGSLGPWARYFFGYSGIGNNGSLTLLAAGLAAFAIWRWTASLRRSAATATLLLGAFSVAVAIHDLLGVRDTLVSSSELAWIDEVGWGLGLVLLSGIALVLLSIPLYRRGRVASRASLNWKQRALVAGVGAVFLIGLGSVASSDPKRSGSESLFLEGPGDRFDARDVGKKILALRPGTPVESAMERLGPPAYGLVLENEAAFYYGAWELKFTEGKLSRRVRYAMPVPDPFSRAYNQRLRVLDRRVRSLRPGASIEAVKAMLGQPEGVEVYGTSLRRDVGLWYRAWRLDFVGRKLRGRY